MREKATGWKLPLLFCAIILLFVGIFRPKKEDVSVPEELQRRAEAIVIDLERDGRTWKEKIIAASGGFRSSEIKDLELERVIGEALENGRFDAACTAIVLVHDQEKKDVLLEGLYRKALQTCDTLPWAVFALKAMKDEQKRSECARQLWETWQGGCGK